MTKIFVKQTSLIIGLLLLTVGLVEASAISISSIKVHEKEGKTFFVVFSDVPLDTQTPSMLGETVVFDLPQDVIWNAESSLESPQGRVKDFSIASGDLEIKLLEKTTLESVIFDDRKKPYKAVFVLKEGDPAAPFKIFKKFKEVVAVPLKKEVQLPKPEFVIQKLRITQLGDDGSSVEITLNKPLKMEPQKVGDKIVIPLPKGTIFQGTQGAVKGHIINIEHIKGEEGDQDKILLHLAPDVALSDWQMTDEATPRLVIKLKAQGASQKAQGFQPASLPVSQPQDVSANQEFTANTQTLADLKNKASRRNAGGGVDPALAGFLEKVTTASGIEKEVTPPLRNAPSQKPQDAMSAFLQKAESASGIEENIAPFPPEKQAGKTVAAITQKGPKESSSIPQEIKFLQIKEHHGKTFLILGINKPETFRVVENNYTRHVTIDLPKINWDKVHVENQEGGFIEGYFIDQSHPKNTTIVITLKEGSGVQKQHIQNGAEGVAFILAFSHNPQEAYHWGSHETYNWGQNTHKAVEGSESIAGETPKFPEAVNEEETVEKPDPFAYQTRKPILNPGDEFQGGNTPITNIGTGLYTGGFVSYAPGQAIVTGTKGADSSYDYKRNLGGFGFGGFVGYGKGIDKFYMGVEGIVQMIFAESRLRTYDGVTSQSSKDSTFWSYGGALRFGAYGSPESLFTVKVGLMGTLFRHRPGANADGKYDYIKSLTQNMAGLLYGFAFETAIQGQWALRFDYTHVDYQHFTKKLSSGGVDHTVRYSPQMDMIMLGLAYKFEPMFGPDNPEDVGIIPTGPYVGTGIDFANFTLRRAFKGALQTYHGKTSNMLPFWNMYLGYGVQHGQLYMGLEGMMSFGTKTIQETLTINGVTESYQAKMQSIMGFYLRPGYAFGHGNLFYGRLGVAMGRFSRSGSGNGTFFTSPATVRKTLMGLSVGAGIEAFMTKNLSLRGEYIYEIYQKMKANADTATETINPTNSKVQVGLSYAF